MILVCIKLSIGNTLFSNLENLNIPKQVHIQKEEWDYMHYNKWTHKFEESQGWIWKIH